MGSSSEELNPEDGWSVEVAAEATSPQIRLADTPITRSTTKLDEASCYLILVDDDIVESYVRSRAKCRPHHDILKRLGYGGHRTTQYCSQYKDADLRIRLLIGELSTVKSALNQINDWSDYLDDTHTQADVVNGLKISLEGCKLAMDALADEVRQLFGNATPESRLNPGFRARTKYAWNESTLQEHENRMRAQIAALQLLLQAARCHSKPEQIELLHNPNSLKIIQKVADDTSTLRATMSAAASHTSQTPTIRSHDESTIDGKIFDWDDEIVNSESYRRALNHARSKSEMPPRPAERVVGFDTSSHTTTEESLDRVSNIEDNNTPPGKKLNPYEMSVISEPWNAYGQQTRPVLPVSSMSEPGHQRRSFLPHRPETPKTDKKSLWPSLPGKRSKNNLAPLERNGTLQSSVSTLSDRRGRRGFENSFHTSIDFASEDGLSAPAIVRAAQAGSVVEVEALLDQRADINARHVQSGRNALSVASHCGNDEVVRLLLQYGAKVNDRDAGGMTPMHLACLRGHCGVIDLLLQEQADIDAKGPNEETPLRIAAEKGQIEAAALLLRKRAKVNARDARQLTPLHVAAKSGDEAMTELLVTHGAHVEAKDGNFMGALHYACEGGHSGVVTCLLNKKADVEAYGKASMTPLVCASSCGQAPVVELLLKKKASLRHKGEGDMTALHWASFNGHVEVLDLLLQKRASITAPNKDGRTPLHLAVMAERFAAAELLLRKGAQIEAQCRHTRRPIHYACIHANIELTRLLLGYNPNIEAEDGSGDKPLHHACARGSLPQVELLLQKGVNIEARNAAGDRALCLACSMGHLDVVKTLLNRGAALRSKYSSGPSHEDSPLCLAAKNGHVSVVQELLTRGASVLQKDEQNWQPLRYAAFYAQPEVVELLLRHGATVSSCASGGWGFNITAHRIGFAHDVSNQEQRKGQVLRLLTTAEAREQQVQEPVSSTNSFALSAVMQSQTSPVELPVAHIAIPFGQTSQSPSPSQPRATAELYSHPPVTNSTDSARYTYYQKPPAVTPEHQSQQTQQLHQPAAWNNASTTSPTFVPGPIAPGQNSDLQGFSYYIPSTMPSINTPMHSQPPAPSYNFVPKAMAPDLPQNNYGQAPGNMTMNSTPQTAGSGSATMTVGPDGVWRSRDRGAQWARDRETLSAGAAQPPNYPPGVYEMAS